VLSTTEKTGLRICSLVPENEARLKEAARILYEGFNECWPDPTLTWRARWKEVRASLGEGRIRPGGSNAGRVSCGAGSVRRCSIRAMFGSCIRWW